MIEIDTGIREDRHVFIVLEWSDERYPVVVIQGIQPFFPSEPGLHKINHTMIVCLTKRGETNMVTEQNTQTTTEKFKFRYPPKKDSSPPLPLPPKKLTWILYQLRLRHFMVTYGSLH